MATWHGIQIEHDNSGVGHNWKPIDREDIPPVVLEEIETAIAEGVEDCEIYVASNGLHYRW